MPFISTKYNNQFPSRGLSETLVQYECTKGEYYLLFIRQNLNFICRFITSHRRIIRRESINIIILFLWERFISCQIEYENCRMLR